MMMTIMKDLSLLAEVEVLSMMSPQHEVCPHPLQDLHHSSALAIEKRKRNVNNMMMMTSNAQLLII